MDKAEITADNELFDPHQHFELTIKLRCSTDDSRGVLGLDVGHSLANHLDKLVLKVTPPEFGRRAVDVSFKTHSSHFNTCQHG